MYREWSACDGVSSEMDGRAPPLPPPVLVPVLVLVLGGGDVGPAAAPPSGRVDDGDAEVAGTERPGTLLPAPPESYMSAKLLLR